MKKLKASALIILALALCLLPVSALASPVESPEPVESPAVSEAVDAPAAVDQGAEPVYVQADETYFNPEGSTIYNNGGTVYNNGGTVYNNAGLVYNNAGLVYNNAGTVYANGGTVYNNAGSVYNNGAAVYTNDGAVDDSRVFGYHKVELAADYSAFADITVLESQLSSEALLIEEGAICTITPKAGYTISSAQAENCRLTRQDDGSYTLDNVEDDFVLSLSFTLEAPVSSLEAGTYKLPQSIELTAAEGADIYYTLDGSEPTPDSEKYQGPIDIEEGIILKALAVQEGAENSSITEAAYAVPQISAPEFEDLSEGYRATEELGLVVDNSGLADARIQSVILSGDDAASFVLSRTSGGKVSAGAVDSTSWTLTPVYGLEKGSYSAIATFTFDSGDTQEFEISITVK